MRVTWRRCKRYQLQQGISQKLRTFSGCADLLVRCRRRRPSTRAAKRRQLRDAGFYRPSYHSFSSCLAPRIVIPSE